MGIPQEHPKRLKMNVGSKKPATMCIVRLTGLSAVKDAEKFEKCFIKLDNKNKTKNYKFVNQIEVNESFKHLKSLNNEIKLMLCAKKHGEKDYIEIGYSIISIHHVNSPFMYQFCVFNEPKNQNIKVVVEFNVNFKSNYIISGGLSVFKEKDFTKFNIISSGNFAVVYRAYHEKSKRFFAYKKFFQYNMKIDSKEFKREAIIPAQFNHPTLMRCEGYVMEKSNKYVVGLVFEYINGCTLEDIFSDEKNDIQSEKWNNNQKTKVMYGIAYGLSILHAHGILHRDLKPSNILLDKNLEPHLSDFGVSRAIDEKEEMTHDVGTVFYQAPEQEDEIYDYDYSSDIYSLGLIYFKLSSSRDKNLKKLFSGQSVTLTNRDPDNDDFSWISSNLRVILRAMLNLDPSKRPRISELLYLMEHNMMSIFDSDFDEVSKYIARINDNPVNIKTIIRNDFVNDQYKALNGDDESLSSIAMESYIFHDYGLSSEYIYLLFLMQEDYISVFVYYWMLKNGIGIAKDLDCEYLIDFLYDQNDEIENYRYGLIDLTCYPKEKDTIYWEAYQMLQGIRSPMTYVEPVRGEFRLIEPYNKDKNSFRRVLRLFSYNMISNEHALVVLAMVYQARIDGLCFNLNQTFDLCALACVHFYNTYGLGFMIDFCRIKRDYKYNEKFGLIGSAHNFIYAARDLAGFYSDRKKYEKSFHFALKAAYNGDGYSIFIVGFLYHIWKDDVETALKYFKRAADLGVENAIRSYGILLFQKGNEEEALKYLSKLKLDRDLINVYVRLYAVRENKEKALEYMKKGAELAENPLFISELMQYYFNNDHKLFLYYAKKGADHHIPECLHKYGIEMAKQDNFDESIRVLTEASNLGYNYSNYNLGCLLYYKYKEYERGIYYLKKGAEGGDNFSKYILGKIYKSGVGVPQDYEYGKQLMQQSIENGGCYMSSFKEGVKLIEQKRYKEAIPYIIGGARDGENRCMQYMFSIYVQLKEFDNAFYWAEKFYEVTGMGSKLGAMYLEGMGVPKDWGIAERYFQEAVAKGDVESNYHLGYIYESIDINKSIHYYAVAADYGELHSIIWLMKYYYSKSIFDQAYKYALSGANLGNVECQVLLGQMYTIGQHVNQNYYQAAIYYQLAASQGDPVAMLNLGIFLKEGKGVECKNIELGEKFISLAAQSNNYYVKDFLSQDQNANRLCRYHVEEKY